MKSSILLVLFLAGAMGASSQPTQKPPSVEIGAGASAFLYQGDLTPVKSGSFKTARGGAYGYAALSLSPRFSVRVNLASGSIMGNDTKYGDDQPYRLQRNYSFKTSLTEASLLLVGNILGNNYKDGGLRIYGLAGIGAGIISVKRDWSRTNTAFFANENLKARIAADSAHTLPKTVLVLPVGLGLKIPLSARLSLAAEWLFRFNFNDYLDGFSYAANEAKRDYYHAASMGLSYRMGKKKIQTRTARRVTGKPAENIAVITETAGRDSDGDGVPDDKDNCPLVKGSINYKGCPVPDTDGDGIDDEHDKCPSTKGLLKYGGCPVPDSDNDGVDDEHDKCPQVYGAVADNGCPAITKEPVAEAEEPPAGSSTVYFEFGKVVLKTEAYATLSGIVSLLKTHKDWKVLLKGHTDNVGGLEANYKMSYARAAVCAAYLQSFYIDKSRITIEAYGKQRPVADINDPLLQWMNRRVEIVIYK